MRALTTRRFPHLAARLRRAQHPDGFTLVELLAAVSIIAIIALPLSMAIAMGFRTVFEVEKKLGSSGDAQTISAYFPADVQSVDAGDPSTDTPDGVNPTDPVNVGVCPAELADQSLLTLLWDHDLGFDGQSVARYLASGKGSDSKLIRRFCKGTAPKVDTVVARNFGSGDPETGPDAATFLTAQSGGTQTPSCTGDACSIEVNGEYRFALSVNRRVPGVTGSATFPGKPTNVHGIGGNHRATIFWTDPPDGGSPITGFAIETTPGNVVAGPFPPGSGATGVQINGLTNFQSYTFRVRAINVIGNGPYSDPSPPVTPGPTVPDPPTTGTATADPAVNGRATLTWSLPPGYNDGGSPINGYRVYALNNPSPPVTLDVTDPEATSATIDGLVDNTRYQLQVTASNASGEGAPSTPSNTVLTLPGKPTISTAQGTSNPGEIKVTFGVPAGGDFADLTNFRLHVLDNDTYTTPVAAATACPGANPTTCTLTVSGLTLGQSYDITVQAQNATGWGPESDPAINIDITPPSVSITSPTNGSASNVTQPVFTGTAGTDADDLPGIVVKIYSGATPTGAPVRSFTTTATGSNWSTLASDVTPALPAGQYTAVAEQTDTGGNTGFSNPVTFVVDGVAPTVAITFPAAGSIHNLGGWNAGCSPAGVCGTASDAAPGTVASVAVTVQRNADGLYWDGSTWVAGPVPAPVTGTTSWKVAIPAASLTNSSYTATAQSTDAAGNVSGFATSTFTADTVAPTVTVEQAAGQADPTNGSTINYTVTFSEPVTGFASNDLTFGGSVGGTKSGAITGAGPTYNVAVTGMSGSGTLTMSIAANRVTDAAGNSNSASTSVDNVVTRDVSAPTVTVNKAAGQADPTNDLPISYTVTFSEPVTGFDNTDLTYGGGVPGTETAVVSGGPTTYNVEVSGLTGSGTLTVSVAANRAQDLAGNNNSASTSSDNSVIYDITSPTVTLTNPANGSSTTDTTPTYSGSCTSGDGTVTVVIRLGATTVQTRTSSCSSGSWNVTGSPALASDTYTAVASQTDAVGNTGTSSTNTFTIDNTPPSVTVNQAAGQADPTNGGPINFTVTFSEPVTGFATNDLTMGGSAGGSRSGTITGSGPTYNVAVTGMSGNGTVTLTIAANRVTDAAGNNNTASTSTDNSVTLDTAAPSVTVNQAAGQADPTATLPISYTVTFSEPVTGFDDTDLTFGGSAGGTRTAVVSGGPTTYTVAVSGLTSSGTSTVSVAANRAQDLAGNNNTASTSSDNTVTFDLTSPTVTINQAGGQADPTGATPIAFTATFSETVTGFTGADVSLSGTAPGTLSASVSGSGPYTVNVTGMTGSGTVIATIPAGGVTDAVGNANTASTSTDNTVTFDGTPPTVTVNQAAGQADPTNGSPINFTVTFSEPVTGFASGDLSFSGSTSGGTKSGAITGSGPTYNVAVTGMTGTGTVVLSIPAGSATDLAGNNNTASTSTDNSVTYDSVAPAVTLTTVNGAGVTFPFVTTGSVTTVGGACTTGDGNVTVTLTGAAAQGPATVPCAAGAWSYTLAPAFTSPGSASAVATQTDAVGNVGSSGSKSISITLPIVYVATPGNGGAAGNDGTAASPLDSVSAAIALAQSRGWTEVRIGQGTFSEGTSGLALASGFTISGGWNVGFAAQTGANTSTVIQGGQQAALADGDTAVVLNRLMLSGLGAPAADRSVYGLRAINGSGVTLTDVRVTAAAAAAGSTGTTGGSGTAGAAGNPGINGSSTGAGGTGGPTFTTGGTGGTGGPKGSNGAVGSPGSGGAAGGTAGTRSSGGLLCGTTGVNGGTGGSGADSTTGGSAGGAGVAAIAGTGTTTWAPAPAATGGSGGTGGTAVSGAGGGGGGGSNGTLCGSQRGGGGGGGGGGGQGGSGGLGGAGGGASIGIYTYNSTVNLDAASSVAAANGGNGGNGGGGGTGGSGGSGGSGGAAGGGAATNGGAGGQGGDGGPGGLGGGGAGGSSVAFFDRGTGAINQGGATATIGTGGAGGSGGTTGQAGTAQLAVNV